VRDLRFSSLRSKTKLLRDREARQFWKVKDAIQESGPRACLRGVSRVSLMLEAACFWLAACGFPCIEAWPLTAKLRLEPSAVLLENVRGLARCKTAVSRALRLGGKYLVSWHHLEPRMLGDPHSRWRWYLILLKRPGPYIGICLRNAASNQSRERL
jgi:hypothetical protein